MRKLIILTIYLVLQASLMIMFSSLVEAQPQKKPTLKPIFSESGSFDKFEIDCRPTNYDCGKAYAKKKGWEKKVKIKYTFNSPVDGELVLKKVSFKEKEQCKSCGSRCGGGAIFLDRKGENAGDSISVNKEDRVAIELTNMKRCPQSDWGTAKHVYPATDYTLTVLHKRDDSVDGPKVRTLSEDALFKFRAYEDVYSVTRQRVIKSGNVVDPGEELICVPGSKHRAGVSFWPDNEEKNSYIDVSDGLIVPEPIYGKEGERSYIKLFFSTLTSKIWLLIWGNRGVCVETSNAVASCMGTQYQVISSPESDEIRVIDGQVNVLPKKLSHDWIQVKSGESVIVGPSLVTKHKLSSKDFERLSRMFLEISGIPPKSVDRSTKSTEAVRTKRTDRWESIRRDQPIIGEDDSSVPIKERGAMEKEPEIPEGHKTSYGF